MLGLWGGCCPGLPLSGSGENQRKCAGWSVAGWYANYEFALGKGLKNEVLIWPLCSLAWGRMCLGESIFGRPAGRTRGSLHPSSSIHESLCCW